MQDFNQAYSFINAITNGAVDTAIVDWRALHDANKGIPGIPFRGTLAECWSSIVHYNSQGYGIFCVISEMDGVGRMLPNVRSIRAHYVDLDNLSAAQNLERAAGAYPAPSFTVQSSPGKFHVYWPVVSYAGNDRFEIIQRKLKHVFDGDGAVIDPTRVMRVPGTYNTKYSNSASDKYSPGTPPHLVTCWALPGYGQQHAPELLEASLSSVPVIHGGGERKELGTPEMAAPSMAFLEFALAASDPNEMDRGEWISFMSAFKQAGWSLTTPEILQDMFMQWCTKYQHNDVAENIKQWNSIRNTEIGWRSIVRRIPSLHAQEKLGDSKQLKQSNPPVNGEAPAPQQVPPMPVPSVDCSNDMLNDIEQRTWFHGCTFVSRFGEILTPSGRLMNSTKFNGEYGGKIFIVARDGSKTTNEPWQAALRSPLWTIPKVDHIRFMPMRPLGDIIVDELGRKGVNTYKPPHIANKPGDISPFLKHLELMLPVPEDRKILLDYIAHNARFPGYKIPWAPLVQSAEGVGKGIIKRLMRHVMGGPYVHFPNAKELIESGSKFNAWMRNKTFILVDEIKVDERRDMIEVLKPMISEAEIEIQGKGADQDKEDNYSNWAFFSNYKDAVPVNKNGRRFSIFYSAIQYYEDLLSRGMDDNYFNYLYSWFDNGGVEHIAHYLLNYPIACGDIPMRAPLTSSTDEAIRQTRGSIEQVIIDAIDDGVPGFKGGWVSTLAASKRIKELGGRSVAPRTISSILEALGYHHIGRSPRPFMAEDLKERTVLYNLQRTARMDDFGPLQGYPILQ